MDCYQLSQCTVLRPEPYLLRCRRYASRLTATRDSARAPLEFETTVPIVQRSRSRENVIPRRSVDSLMSDDVVTATVTEGVGRMQIERPESLNAFTPRVLEELHDAIRSFEADDDVRAILFTAAGDKAFCAGVDLGDEGGLGIDAGGAGYRPPSTARAQGAPTHAASRRRRRQRLRDGCWDGSRAGL